MHWMVSILAGNYLLYPSGKGGRKRFTFDYRLLMMSQPFSPDFLNRMRLYFPA
ncbi:MAG: hypothetical protein A4E34_02052 [Methanoregula sp. PtaU1.Bin006]|nr:MAG: hypothetical protein A4E33_00841 [Methanoregula sp. PtaB.Bin085]OPY33347.1 MAG: hypothetical protein A4E34_02052 [Methanoregula sp. PtaU1.Bin006]